VSLCVPIGTYALTIHLWRADPSKLSDIFFFAVYRRRDCFLPFSLDLSSLSQFEVLDIRASAISATFYQQRCVKANNSNEEAADHSRQRRQNLAKFDAAFSLAYPNSLPGRSRADYLKRGSS